MEYRYQNLCEVYENYRNQNWDLRPAEMINSLDEAETEEQLPF
jgi:hypothetical protein